MLIGYARVSKHEQNLNLQLDSLKKAGCTQIFTDKETASNEERKGLMEALNYLRDRDTLVVWRLDRLGRSLRHLIDEVNALQSRGVGFKSITENIDTTTPGGKLVFHIFGALAEFERDLIKERTRAGLEAARTRGKKGGRPASLTAKKAQMAQELYTGKNHTIPEICKMLGISRATLYRHIEIPAKAGEDKE